MNSLECKVPGPSGRLPSGVDVADLYVNPVCQTLAVSITDRRDFYHQIGVTRAKSIANTVGPPVPSALVAETKALGTFLMESKRSKYKREVQGDGLHLVDGPRHISLLVEPPEDHVWISLYSILQGDHIGVEVTTDGHTNLLSSYGLLRDDVVLQADRPLKSSTELQGLCIDDFFCVSVEPAQKDLDHSRAKEVYEVAQKAYSEHLLLGSPQKDIVASDCGKTIGAFVNSSQNARRHNLVTLGAPCEKRLALSYLTLQLCRLSHTTDSLHLCLLGAWVSVLAYRRPLLSILSKSFRLVDNRHFNRDKPKLLQLPRAVANELTMLALLVPFALFAMSAKYMDQMYCTDASSKKGAICVASCPEGLSEVLWRTGKSKGAYTRLLSPVEVALRNLGEFDYPDALNFTPNESSNLYAWGGADFSDTVPRPICHQYDFIEVFAGASLITKHLTDLGVSCGPPLDISLSEEYDLSSSLVMQWLTHLIAEKRVKAFFVCPPCTTFSIMRRPSLRDSEEPFGFDPCDPQTQTVNTLAHRGCQLMKVGEINEAIGMLEQPFTSKMKHLPAWKVVETSQNVSTVRCDSCRFGSPHQKGFKLVGLRIDMSPLNKRCICKGKHLQVQGSFTKSSAIYTPLLARTIAECFYASLSQLHRARESAFELSSKGLEDQLVNDVVVSSEWSRQSSWTFKKESHINILEMCSLLRLANQLVEFRQPLRVVNFVDSFVVRGAASKGRSASLGLSTIIRRFCAVSVAAFLFFSLPFVPTRLNPADDPTRDRDVRSPQSSVRDASWGKDELYALAALPKNRRWASGWVRLVLHLIGKTALSLHDRSTWRQTSFLKWFEKSRHDEMDFDSTLGFPGEGPPSHGSFWLMIFFAIGFRSSWTSLDFFCGLLLFRRSAAGCFCWVLCCASCPVPTAMAMPVSPGTPAEIARAASRRERGPLPEGRPVLPRTGSQREKFLAIFLEWSENQGFDFVDMLSNHYTCIDEINILLTRYGRTLYQNGKSYNMYAETLNAITSWRPAIRRMLQGAWDLGYTWMREEPGNHHIAMPHQICLGMITTCFMWGWTHLAGIIALGFGALLRPGELLNLVRSDLLLPRDAGFGVNFGLIAIREAKTRFTHARLQNAKLDISDLLNVVDLVFGNLAPQQRLWPQSGTTLRARFRSVLESLSLCNIPSSSKLLDLGSLRAGGSTYILQHTENGELLRRRGRWANYKMMEIYVQELGSVLYLQIIDASAKTKVFSAAAAFLDVYNRAVELSAAKIPLHVWYILFSKRK